MRFFVFYLLWFVVILMIESQLLYVILFIFGTLVLFWVSFLMILLRISLGIRFIFNIFMKLLAMVYMLFFIFR